MPNFCNNNLKIHFKNLEDYESFLKLVQNNDNQNIFDFSNIIKITDIGSENKVWGTKWNSFNITSNKNKDSLELSYFFNTAWNPPIPIIKKIIEFYPDIYLDFEYEEEGCNFGGNIIYENKILKESFINDLMNFRWNTIQDKHKLINKIIDKVILNNKNLEDIDLLDIINDELYEIIDNPYLCDSISPKILDIINKKTNI